MALEGTHIRLAIDVMDKYAIQDVAAYVSGTVYPDSRYMTGIERVLTHDASYLEKGFAQDDFQKGWQLHLLCDDIQLRCIRDLLGAGDGKIGQNGDLWIDITVIMVLQEISDLKFFNIEKYLSYIKPLSRPNDENMEKLDGYYSLVRNFYVSSDLRPEDYRQIFVAFSIPDDVSDAVIARCAEFQADGLMMKKINQLYPEILNGIKLVN